MRAGPLRHRVTLQEPVETQTASGDPEVTWQDFKSVRADLLSDNGREKYQADQIRSESDSRFVIRWDQAVFEWLTPRCRILHKGVAYNVVQVLPDYAHQRRITIRTLSGINRG